MSVIYKNNGPIYLTQAKFDALVTKVPGQEYCIITDDEYATLTQLNTKLNIAQGTENAGLFMKVGTDGNLTPSQVSTYQQLPADLCKPNTFNTLTEFMTKFITDYPTYNVKGNCLIGSIYIMDGPSADGGGEIVLQVFTDTSVQEIGNYFIINFYSNGAVYPNHWMTIYQGSAQVIGWIGGSQINTIPQNSPFNAGKVKQYIGPTDDNFTYGYFYQCNWTRGSLACVGTGITVSDEGDRTAFLSKKSTAVSGQTYVFTATGTEGAAATGLELDGTTVEIESSVKETLISYGILVQGTDDVQTGATVSATYTEDVYSWDRIDVQPKSSTLLKDEEGYYFEYESTEPEVEIGTLNSILLAEDQEV